MKCSLLRKRIWGSSFSMKSDCHLTILMRVSKLVDCLSTFLLSLSQHFHYRIAGWIKRWVLNWRRSSWGLPIISLGKLLRWVKLFFSMLIKRSKGQCISLNLGHSFILFSPRSRRRKARKLHLRRLSTRTIRLCHNHSSSKFSKLPLCRGYSDSILLPPRLSTFRLGNV